MTDESEDARATGTGPDAETRDLDALLGELRERVEERRRAGLYPAELTKQLDTHFDRLVGERPSPSPALYQELGAAVQALAHFEFSRARIDPVSDLPGGTLTHRVIGKAVSRQIQGVLEQAQAHAHAIARTIELLADVTVSVGREYDQRVLQQLDDLQVHLAEHARSLHELTARIEETAARVPGAVLHPFYREDHFTQHFRGATDEVRERYRDLAARFVGHEPVLEIGFGRGEFLELLVEAGVEARGIEPDEHLVDIARGRGLDVEPGRAVEYLERLDHASLGGLVMIQVIEHLSPQHVIDVVRLAWEKLKPGGVLAVETVNPASLYTYARAFWIDPDHTRPIHPAFMEFLVNQAGFRSVEIEGRSPVPENEALETLPGDDETTKRLNMNFERVNAILFGPQDYALIATR